MTTLLNREQTTVEDQPLVDETTYAQPGRVKPKRLRMWMVAFAGVAAIAAATYAATSTTQSQAVPEGLDYRVVGESEALARFAPAAAVDAGLDYRVVGESEALARFAAVDAGLDYRVVGQSEALTRFATSA